MPLLSTLDAVPTRPAWPTWTLSVPRPSLTWSTKQIVLALLGGLLLVLWSSWWVGGLKKNQLKKSPTMWFSRYHFLGLDFLHNYHAARYWLDGGDPYREPFGDPLGRKLCYPPIVLPFFAWCRAVEPRTAVAVWTASLAGLTAFGAWSCWRTRRSLGLESVPYPFALATVLMSAPVAYAMERGNYDLLLVPLILGTAAALQKRTVYCDLIAGTCLALATCFKVYPALLIVALVPIGRARAALVAVAAVGLFAAFQYDDLPVCAANLRELARENNSDRVGVISPSGHSLAGGWRLMWHGTRYGGPGRIPGTVAALAVLGPVLAWVGYRIARCPDPRRVLVPYFLWIAAAATFLPQVANDYSLVFLPLAALAVWSRRDPLPVQLGLAALVLWAQPVAFGIDPAVLLALKAISVVAVGLSLANRIREQVPGVSTWPAT